MPETVVFTDRTLKPLAKKLNPLWWFQNDDEQKLNDGTTDWYMPGRPEWLRRIFWEFRNPLQNFRAYVIGVQDRNYTVVGKAPALTVQRDDIGETGWQWSVIKFDNSPIRLPFISYSGKHVVWYIGHQPSGFFGMKFNIKGTG